MYISLSMLQDEAEAGWMYAGIVYCLMVYMIV